MGTGCEPSRVNITSCALGSRKRKVTLPSACTSGLFKGGGGGAGCAWAQQVAEIKRRSDSVRFMDVLCAMCWLSGREYTTYGGRDYPRAYARKSFTAKFAKDSVKDAKGPIGAGGRVVGNLSYETAVPS